MKGENLGFEGEEYYKARSFIENVVNAKELGYIYTFPDKRAYHPVENSKSFIENAWEGHEGKIGLYVHTPYCTPKPAPEGTIKQMHDADIKTEGRDHLCGYCNLFTAVVGGVPRGYTDDVISEVGLYRDLFTGRSLEASSVYFGGGTPTILSSADIKRTYDALESMVGKFSDDIEKAIETAPDLVDREKLEALREIGFNRVSVGVQTFDEQVLHFTGRRYDPRLGYQAVKDAMEVGFENVNADIIMGLPSSSKETFLRDISLVRELSPHTVTLYQDMTRPLTRFGKMNAANILPLVSSGDIYAWTEIADELLAQDGYRRQSLTAWEKNGGGYQQGENIYRGIPILGIGAGARSHAPNGHYSTEYTVSTRLTNYLIGRWRESVQRGEFPDIQGIEMKPDLKIRERAVLGLMSPEGASGEDLQGKFSLEFQALKDAKMISQEGNQWKYTPKGKAYSGALATLFFGKDIENQLSGYAHH